MEDLLHGLLRASPTPVGPIADAGVRWQVRGWFTSTVAGGDSNTECFAWAQALALETA